MGKDSVEIRWHGRGGQGAKTAAGMVAEVAVSAGKHGQGAPEYGAEREGAPIKAYTRISEDVIKVHDAIYYPDIVIVLDETLIESESVTDGLAEDGILLVNTERSPEQVREELQMQGRKIYTVDATGIAIDEIGRPIPNTVMTAALAKVTGVVHADDVKKSIKKKLGAKLSEAVLQGNMTAVDRGFKEVRGENE
jgi:pyruvate ferredoxin oxidoreductase gamma subunit